MPEPFPVARTAKERELALILIFGVSSAHAPHAEVPLAHRTLSRVLKTEHPLR